jgi:hypothetical protein
LFKGVSRSDFGYRLSRDHEASRRSARVGPWRVRPPRSFEDAALETARRVEREVTRLVADLSLNEAMLQEGQLAATVFDDNGNVA